MFLEAEFIDSNYAVKHTKEINFFSKFFHSQEIKEYDLLICPEKLNKRANEYFKNQFFSYSAQATKRTNRVPSRRRVVKRT